MYNQESNSGRVISRCYFLTFENIQRHPPWLRRAAPGPPVLRLRAATLPSLAWGHQPCLTSTHPPVLGQRAERALWPVGQPHKSQAQKAEGESVTGRSPGRWRLAPDTCVCRMPFPSGARLLAKPWLYIWAAASKGKGMGFEGQAIEWRMTSSPLPHLW